MKKLWLLILGALFFVGTAQATNFTVGSTLDGSDASPGNGICATSINNCTLRAAIEEANAFAGDDYIEFAIPGAGVKTLRPASPYPQITEDLTINGWTQGGLGADPPRIEIDGTNAGVNAIGLQVAAGAEAVFFGLAINRFFSYGIYLRGGGNGSTVWGCYIGTDPTGNIALGNGGGILIADANSYIGSGNADHRNIISGNDGDGIEIITLAATGNKIIGNYIGTNASGTADLGNGGAGVSTQSSDNIIGGDSLSERNVISGNKKWGIFISGGLGAATGNEIIGNYIGTDVSGTLDLGNDYAGIYVFLSSGNQIGGTITPYAGNLISGNAESGIDLYESDANFILGNYIGTDASGIGDLGNDGNGVSLDDSSSNQVGGLLANEPNIIAFNGDNGVEIDQFDFDPPQSSSVGNSIRGNSIYSNGGLGIDLLPAAGVTVNDAGDNDEGPNNLLNFPVLTVAENAGGSATTIEGSLNAKANVLYNIDFYSSASCDSSGNGEGEIYVGSTAVTTGAGGNATFTFSPAVQIAAGRFITAATTRNALPLNTSEFSECVQVTNLSTVVTNTSDAGAGSLRQAILDANTLPGLDTITFNIPLAGVQTINLLSPLPTVTGAVIIDGSTQPNFANAPLIELNGASAGAGSDGLNISAGGSTVKSLTINRFGGDGIELSTGGGNTIIGCFIGTGSGGASDLGNTANGILINGSANNRIGGANLSAHNVISGNTLNGILISGVASTGNTIAGNLIGANFNGNADLGNSQNGIDVSSASGNTIGGATADLGNLISGNDANGIRFTTAPGNQVRNNFIGTDGDGTVDLGNATSGVFLNNDSTGNTIGGGTGKGNRIAFNLRGVNVVGSATGNSIRGNSIYSNDNLGIDLFPVGLTANDEGDADTGANNKQNFPVLSSVFNAGGDTNIQGSLNSTADASFHIDFYSSASCDSSGNGEGEIYIGSTATMTGAGGNAAFTFAPAEQVAAGRFITATATRKVAPLDTSEFSECVAVLANPGNLSFSAATYSANENVGTKTIVVNRSGGSNGQISVNYAASNNTAIAGVDYIATNGTLVFLSGETSKSFEIPVTDDLLDEPNETVNLTLSNPTFGVSLAPNASANLTINDNDSPPQISIDNVSHEEGNDGTINYTFTVELSAPSSFDISVDYATANGSATSSIDYVSKSGTLDFSAAAAETSKTVKIVVNGDLQVELNEIFFVNLSNPTHAAFGDNQGTGTIVDDDNPGKFRFNSAPYSGVENSQVTVTVARINGDAGTVSVDYSTVSIGSASPSSDYTPESGTLVFGDGETTKTFTVNLLDDAQTEPTENFNVVLSNPIGGAGLGAPSTAAVNILDNDSGTLHAIAGEITRANGTPLIGATVNLTGAVTATTTTNNLGRYAFQNLAPNGTYSVTPSALGFTFEPISRQYSNLSIDIANANFTATAAPTRQLRVVGGNATPMQNTTATVELVAQGDENSVGFSLNFNQNILMNPQVVLNAAASTASLIVNDQQAGAGKLGILLALPPGQRFTVGTKSLVTVTFNTTATNLYSSPITFGDAPIVSQVSNTNANPLPVNYLDGAVTFAQGWEADLADRPTGTNSGTITVSDFTQVGRFAAGLDTNYQLNEFQRADCAPRDSLGDGSVTVSDYTQAGRYAAHLDPATLTGGQYAPRFFQFDGKGKLLSNQFDILSEDSPTAPTVVRVVGAQASTNTQVTVSIEVVAQGLENGFGFTLNYDDAKLSNPQVELGSGVPANSTLIPNTDTAGKAGVILGLPFNFGMTAGTKQLVTIRFDVTVNAAAGQTALTFADAPVVREVADKNAVRMQSTFQNGAVNILGPTAASVSVGGRVLSATNRGVSGARVILTNASGNVREARTNSFGYYNFALIPAGETYIFTVAHKRFEFLTRVVFISEDLSGFDFVSISKLPF